MNQEQIGKFISKCRKNKHLTQEQLAEMLHISNRAVSKWERGINLPDASLMLELSNILDISVNELLSGEIIEKKNYMDKAEKNLIELKEINEEYIKKLLYFEYIIGFNSSIAFLILIFLASFIDMNALIRILIIIFGCIILIIGMTSCLKIEQIAGYYECANCHNRYIPTFRQVFLAMHAGRTRRMKCPRCHKKTWNKKVMTK